MRLFLLRHAHASDTFPDSERQITSRGFGQIRKLSAALDASIFADLVEVWHSPYARARQTAQEFANLKSISAPLREVKTLRPDDSPFDIAKEVAMVSSFGGDLLIVGHNPHLEALADLLLNCHDSTCKTTFQKCSLAMFVMTERATSEKPYGSWALSFLFSPMILSR